MDTGITDALRAANAHKAIVADIAKLEVGSITMWKPVDIRSAARVMLASPLLELRYTDLRAYLYTLEALDCKVWQGGSNGEYCIQKQSADYLGLMGDTLHD